MAASVQGVVVQIMKQTVACRACSSVARPSSTKRLTLSSVAGKLTKMLGDAMSLYSSSASARAVSHSTHQWIGLELLVDQALAHEIGEDFQNPGLVRGLEREVRIVELAEDAQILELAGSGS